MSAPLPLILRGDARNLPIADASVDLIVTSPPYFGQRSYQDGGEHYQGQIGDESSPYEFLDALIEATAEMVRVLKPAGSIWVNLGDKYANDAKWGGSTGGKHVPALHGQAGPGRGKRATGLPAKSLMGIPWRYAIRCIDELGLSLRAEVIWHKVNGMPESVKDRVARRHEHLFHLAPNPRYFADIDPIREPHVRMDGPRPLGTRNQTQRHLAATDNTGWKDHDVAHHPKGRTPGSVWDVPTQGLDVPEHLGVDHHAAFPLELPRRIISAWSPAGGTVLDPFAGSGTTALAARVLGRDAISVDLSRDYCRLARWRVSDPGELARAMQVEKPPAAPEDMDSLLDLLGEIA